MVKLLLSVRPHSCLDVPTSFQAVCCFPTAASQNTTFSNLPSQCRSSDPQWRRNRIKTAGQESACLMWKLGTLKVQIQSDALALISHVALCNNNLGKSWFTWSLSYRDKHSEDLDLLRYSSNGGSRNLSISDSKRWLGHGCDLQIRFSG